MDNRNIYHAKIFLGDIKVCAEYLFWPEQRDIMDLFHRIINERLNLSLFCLVSDQDEYYLYNFSVYAASNDYRCVIGLDKEKINPCITELIFELGKHFGSSRGKFVVVTDSITDNASSMCRAFTKNIVTEGLIKKIVSKRGEKPRFTLETEI